MSPLRAHLDALIRDGRKLLVPYLMAGIPDRASFPDALAAVSESADAVELGLPFSDPLMDGPVIAEAAQRALRGGLGPVDALEAAGPGDGGPPRVAMTYYNPIHRTGEREFCERAAAAGIAGLIVPDLPVEESEPLRGAAAAAGLAWIPLVAPTSPPDRVAAITATATGFVYAVSTLGVTGTREQLSERAARVVAACREATDAPVLVGIGVSSPAHAVEAAATADGVVIGTAVVRLVLEEGAGSARAFLADVRAALNGT
ncbi:MAG TPA: tryptophan synthase subunit alpha [Actinomycetota bacterium]|nr:tryptophan synthase subunit alpha [Actinomycetota bacterium]